MDSHTGVYKYEAENSISNNYTHGTNENSVYFSGSHWTCCQSLEKITIDTDLINCNHIDQFTATKMVERNSKFGYFVKCSRSLK